MEMGTMAVAGGERGGSSGTAVIPSEQLIRIDSICIDLAYAMERNNDLAAGKCKHFSIRGYVAERRRKDPLACAVFSTATNQAGILNEQFPPLHVPKYRWWRCQRCLQDPGVGETSANGHSNVDEHNENTATGDTTVDVRNNGSQDGSVHESAGKDHDQAMYGFCPGQMRRVDARGELTKGSKRQTAAVQSNDSNLVEPSQQINGSHGGDYFPSTRTSLKETLTSKGEVEIGAVSAADQEHKEDGILDAANCQLGKQPYVEMESGYIPSPERGEMSAEGGHDDQQNEDSNGFPHRRTRKVRLMTDLLCGGLSKESKHHKKEGSPFLSIINESSASASVSAKSPNKAVLCETVFRPPPVKRKMPYSQENWPSNGSKKVKESSTAVGVLDNDKHKWTKNEMPRNSIAGKNKRKLTLSGDQYTLYPSLSDIAAKLNTNARRADKQGACTDTNYGKPSVDEASAVAGLSSSDKHKLANPEMQRDSALGKQHTRLTQVDDIPVVSGQEVIAKMDNMRIADKKGTSADNTSKLNHDRFTSTGINSDTRSYASQHPEIKSSSEKKKSNKSQLEDGQALIMPQINHMIRDGSQRNDLYRCGSAPEDFRTETELGLSLSLNPGGGRNDKDYVTMHEDQTHLPLPVPKRARKDDLFVGQSSIPFNGTRYPTSKERSFHNLGEKISNRSAVLHEDLNFSPQFSNRRFSPSQKLDFSDPLRNKENGMNPRSAEVKRVHNHKRPEKVFAQKAPDDIPMDIVGFLAKNQYERGLCEAGTSCNQPGPSNKRNSELIGYPKVNGNDMSLFENEYPSMRKSTFSRATNGIIPTAENLAPIRSSASFFYPERNCFNIGQQLESRSYAMLGMYPEDQQKFANAVHFSSSGNPKNQIPQGSKLNGNLMAQRSSPSNMQMLKTYNTCRDFQQKQTAPKVTFQNRMPIGVNSPQSSVAQSINLEVRDFDLNIVVQNDGNIDEQNKILISGPLNTVPGEDTWLIKDKRLEHNSKQMGALDSSYSNDSIPAMQLLSLMDAGIISKSPFGFDGKKFLEKPFSPCSNHPSMSTDGYTNSMLKPHISYSGLKPGAPKPVDKSSDRPPTIPVVSGFSLFRNDGNVNGPTSFNDQGVARVQQQQKSKGVSYTPSQIHEQRPEEYLYTVGGSSQTSRDKQRGGYINLPWHRNEDSSQHFGVNAQFMQGTPRPANCQQRTNVCTVNKNPADFSSPEPWNPYMITSEDLKPKKVYFMGNSVLENLDGRKRQKVAKATQKQLVQYNAP